MNLRRLVASVSLDAGAYLRELEDTLGQLTRKHDQTLQRVAWLSEEHDALARELATTRLDRDTLRARNAQLEAEVVYQTTRAQNLEVEAATTRNDLDDANGRIQFMTVQITDLVGIRDALKSELGEAAQEIEHQAIEHARTMFEMKTALDEANARIDEFVQGGQIRLLSVEAVPEPPPAKPEVVSDTTQRRVYQIVKLALEGGYKWYFTDGGAETFNAAILDEEFAAKVDRREIAFAHGDALEVDVHIVSTRTGKQLKSQYEFVKVHRHLVPDEQPSLPFNNPPAEPASAEGVVS